MSEPCYRKKKNACNDSDNCKWITRRGCKNLDWSPPCEEPCYIKSMRPCQDSKSCDWIPNVGCRKKPGIDCKEEKGNYEQKQQDEINRLRNQLELTTSVQDIKTHVIEENLRRCENEKQKMMVLLENLVDYADGKNETFNETIQSVKDKLKMCSILKIKFQDLVRINNELKQRLDEQKESHVNALNDLKQRFTDEQRYKFQNLVDINNELKQQLDDQKEKYVNLMNEQKSNEFILHEQKVREIDIINKYQDLVNINNELKHQLDEQKQKEGQIVKDFSLLYKNQMRRYDELLGEQKQRENLREVKQFERENLREVKQREIAQKEECDICYTYYSNIDLKCCKNDNICSYCLFKHNNGQFERTAEGKYILKKQYEKCPFCTKEIKYKVVSSHPEKIPVEPNELVDNYMGINSTRVRRRKPCSPRIKRGCRSPCKWVKGKGCKSPKRRSPSRKSSRRRKPCSPRIKRGCRSPCKWVKGRGCKSPKRRSPSKK